MDGVSVTDCVDVRKQVEKHALHLTSELALLPRGFEATTAGAELAHEADAATVRKLLKAAGLDVQQLQPQGRRLPSVVQHSADWIAPTLFVGSMLLSQNPYAVQIALGVINSYVSDVLKGRTFPGSVKLAIIIEETKSKKCRRVDYEGPPSGLKDLAEVLNELQNKSQ